MPKWKRVICNKTWQMIYFLSIACLWDVLTTIFASAASTGSSLDVTIIYNFTDNITVGTTIGNIRRDAKLSRNYTQHQLSNIHFNFLQMRNPFLNLQHKKKRLLRQNQQELIQSYFKIRENTGMLKSLQTIDRDDLCPGESQCIIQLDVAIRFDKYFGVIRVIISLEDYNDNPPVFEDSNLEYSISESVSPGVILHIQPAFDRDSPENGVKKYFLICDHELFELELSSSTPEDASKGLINHANFEIKILLLKQLDREYEFRHKLILNAHDGGNPSRSGNLTIVLNVEDVNDNSPKFINPSMAIKVIEGTPRGTMLIHLHAMDQDTGINGKVVYSFTNETLQNYGNYFKIKESTGKIILKHKLDYEERTSYTLSVIARDLGVNSIPAKAKIIVNVIDINDNSPVITIHPEYEENRLLIMEDAEPDTVIAHISAQDKDSNQNGMVSCILNEASYEMFQLHQAYDGEYKLMTRTFLDREIREEYTLNITCHDQGSPVSRFSQVTMYVAIVDVNDHVPQFENEIYETMLFENNPTGITIVQVNAIEPDSGVNGIIHYELQNAGKVFRINKTSGLIETTESLDREILGDMIDFQVLAIDRAVIPQTSTATVRINILDLDDEPPKFNQKKYMFSISENLKEIQSIGFVSAQDLDLPPSNNFSFYIDQKTPYADAFTIDAKTGEMFAIKEFDRELKPFHNVNVTVISDNNENFSDTSLVQVLVSDVNDNAPNITFPSINNNKVYIANSDTPGYLVTTITAVDSDVGLSGRVTYHFADPFIKIPFTIEEYTGNVYLNQTVSHIIHRLIPVDILVRDRGEFNQLSTTAVLNLIITNKLSQENAWDETRAQRDKGLSMVVRIVIVVVVVVLVIVAIILLSLLIHNIVAKTDWGERFEFFSSNITIQTDNNGFIPNSVVMGNGGLSIGKKRYSSETLAEDTEVEVTEPETQWILNSHKKKAYSLSSCPDLSETEESMQPFLTPEKGTSQETETQIKYYNHTAALDDINRKMPPTLSAKRKYIPGPPPPYASSQSSSQSTEYLDNVRRLSIHKYSAGGRRLPTPPDFYDPFSRDKCHTWNNQDKSLSNQRSVYFQSDLNISLSSNLYNNFGKNCNSDKNTIKAKNMNTLSSYANKASVMFKSDTFVQDVDKTNLDAPIKIKLQPDLQNSTTPLIHRRIEAYPDLLQHRQQKNDRSFEQGSRKLYDAPFKDPWDNLHLHKDKLKHSIPGHCTILAASSSDEGNKQKTISVDDLAVKPRTEGTWDNACNSLTRNLKQRRQSDSKDGDGYYSRVERNRFQKHFSVSTSALNKNPQNTKSLIRVVPQYVNDASPGNILLPKYDTKSIQRPHLAINPQHQTAKRLRGDAARLLLNGQNNNNSIKYPGVEKLPDNKLFLHKSSNNINSIDRRVHINSLGRNFNRPRAMSIDYSNHGRREIDRQVPYSKHQYNGNISKIGNYRSVKHIVENGDSDGSYI